MISPSSTKHPPQCCKSSTVLYGHSPGCYYEVLDVAVVLKACFISAHACEDAQLRISCAHDAIINVQSAVYGRMNNKICPVKKQQDSWSCAASTSLSMAQQICEGEHSCKIKARNSVFGDPCKGVRKYLEIKYVCKKRKLYET